MSRHFLFCFSLVFLLYRVRIGRDADVAGQHPRVHDTAGRGAEVYQPVGGVGITDGAIHPRRERRGRHDKKG